MNGRHSGVGVLLGTHHADAIFQIFPANASSKRF